MNMNSRASHRRIPDRLPKPFDELSDTEFSELFDAPKPPKQSILGETALGSVVVLPDEAFRQIQRVVEEATKPDVPAE